MKIDIHTHTKKCKSGDAPTREISPDDFCKTILATDVRIVAITNHNVFDLEQYAAIESKLKGEAQVWPGIEFDVIERGSRGHLLIIVSSKLAKKFSVAINEFTRGFSPDDFTATIERVLGIFDPLKPLYVAHYRKKPDLSDEAIAKLLIGTKQKNRVVKEASSSISAGIYISHGHASIYGSDVHDWGKYVEDSRELPDLRLPVESFEHFCLLLDKDPTTINTALNKKISEELILAPFDDGSTLRLRVFNDINVIFGPKGTGKTCILNAIAKHYATNGISVSVYKSASDRLNELFDTRGKDLPINLEDFNINYCNDEIAFIRSAVEVDVTAISKYCEYCGKKATNRNALRILLKDIEPEQEAGPKREFLEHYRAVNTSEKFRDFLDESSTVKNALTESEYEQLAAILSKLLERLSTLEWRSFAAWKEICLLNSAISEFRKQIGRKTGTPVKPTTTGFRAYAMNRIRIELNAAEIVKNVETQIPTVKERIGSLGPSKGELECRTEFKFQTGTASTNTFLVLNKSGVKKGTQKDFMKCIRAIFSSVYSDDLFQKVAELNEIDDVEDIKTVFELLLFKKYFAIDGNEYVPSSGEASMVGLQRELEADKDIYILDEPERSLGNEYINDVIVPLIRERGK